MPITFAVDDVAPVLDRLPTRPLDGAVASALGIELHQLSHRLDVIAQGKGFHPLLEAVHVAFAQHRPLTLSPDHVWLTLAQGFASHVDRSAEALRERLVRHQGRKELLVEVGAVPEGAAAWGEVIGAFTGHLAEHVGAGMHRLLSASFSTTTEVERVAGGVVMMSAFKRYFDYSMRCVCGIPTITLEGTPSDWADIRRRLDVLAEYDLEWWAIALRPVLDELVRTAEGKPDRDFWQCMYKPKEVYGGDQSTGWIMRLFPYVDFHGRSPAVLEAVASSDARARWITPGVSPASVPLSWSNARLRVSHANGTRKSYTLYGGFGGVRQVESGALRPEVAWAVGATPRMTGLVERILAEHVTTPVREPASGNDRSGRELPAELIELYERMNGAVLFDRWTVVPRAELVTMVGDPERGFEGLDPRRSPGGSYSPTSKVPVVPFCLLANDPRFLAIYESKVLLCDPRVAQDSEHIPVVALTVADFFERLLEHEGRLWFDDAPSGEVLYPHLSKHHEHLRRTLREPRPGEPIPTGLSSREKERTVMSICFGRVSGDVQVRVWWEALRLATGTTLTFEEVFRKEQGRAPMHVLEDLGLTRGSARSPESPPL